MEDDTELETLARMILHEHHHMDNRPEFPNGCQCPPCRLCKMVLAPLDGRAAAHIARRKVYVGEVIMTW